MILSGAIVDKDGTIYVARQYCDMTKAKVEALYLAFARLITKDKDSNILEDIKTLSIFVSATNHYASIGKGVTEEGLEENRFDLLFAFDEIVNMGERQLETLEQLVTVMKMESEEERKAIEVLGKKEREAKAKAAEKSKELDQQRRNEMLHQMERSSMGGRGGFGMSAISSSTAITDPIVEPVETKPAKPTKGRSRALKLGKSRN